MYYVVGSGPSGVMCAQALLDCGAPVTMLDVGVQCEPERLAAVSALSRLDPQDWEPALLEKIRFPARAQEMPLKLCYGSDFPYAKNEMGLLSQHGTKCLQSFAKGGLSNVWGASVLPNLREDFAGWPLTLEEMAPHYAAVARSVKIAGAHDDLEALFPFYHPPLRPATMSRQAQRLVERTALRAEGILFGQSRLAVRTQDEDSGKACQYTGLCLSGCPYMAIWNSADTVESLQVRPGFTYRNKLMVVRIECPDTGGVRVHCRCMDNFEAVVFEGARAFLGCGVISTSKIVIDSLKGHGKKFILQFQPYFLLPLMAFRNTPDVAAERLHTLAQLYIDILDPKISSHPIHMQLYTNNEFIRERLRAATRFLGPGQNRVRRIFEGRLMAIQGYLHSAEAGGIELTSVFAPGGGHLELRARCGLTMRRTIRRAVAKLAANSRKIGAMPLWPLMRFGIPGEGNHIGGIFPMRLNPRDFESDALGRLAGLPRVHIVDASVLTNLSATTLTYTMMANAHRIATAAAKLDQTG